MSTALNNLESLWLTLRSGISLLIHGDVVLSQQHDCFLLVPNIGCHLLFLSSENVQNWMESNIELYRISTVGEYCEMIEIYIWTRDVQLELFHWIYSLSVVHDRHSQALFLKRRYIQHVYELWLKWEVVGLLVFWLCTVHYFCIRKPL